MDTYKYLENDRYEPEELPAKSVRNLVRRFETNTTSKPPTNLFKYKSKSSSSLQKPRTSIFRLSEEAPAERNLQNGSSGSSTFKEKLARFQNPSAVAYRSTSSLQRSTSTNLECVKLQEINEISKKTSEIVSKVRKSYKVGSNFYISYLNEIVELLIKIGEIDTYGNASIQSEKLSTLQLLQKCYSQLKDKIQVLLSDESSDLEEIQLMEIKASLRRWDQITEQKSPEKRSFVPVAPTYLRQKPKASSDAKYEDKRRTVHEIQYEDSSKAEGEISAAPDTTEISSEPSDENSQFEIPKVRYLTSLFEAHVENPRAPKLPSPAAEEETYQLSEPYKYVLYSQQRGREEPPDFQSHEEKSDPVINYYGYYEIKTNGDSIGGSELESSGPTRETQGYTKYRTEEEVSDESLETNEDSNASDRTDDYFRAEIRLIRNDTQTTEDSPRITEVTDENYAYIKLSEPQEPAKEKEDTHFERYTTVDERATNNEESAPRTDDISKRSDATEELQIKTVKADDVKEPITGDQTREIHIYPTKSEESKDLEERDRGQNSNQQTDQFAQIAQFVAPSYEDGGVSIRDQENDEGNVFNVKLNVEEFDRREIQDDTQAGEHYPRITKTTEENYAYITLSEAKEPSEEKEDGSYKQYKIGEQRSTNNEKSGRRTEDNLNRGHVTEEPQINTVEGDDAKVSRTGDQTIVEPHIYAITSEEPENLEERNRQQNSNQQTEQYAPVAYLVAPSHEDGDVSGRSEENDQGNSINVKLKVEGFKKREIQDETQTGADFSIITRVTEENYAYITLSEPQEQTEEEKEDGTNKPYTTVEQKAENNDESARRTEDNSNRGNATEEPQIKNLEADDAKTPRTGDQSIEELHSHPAKSEESEGLEGRDRGQTSNQQTEQYAPVAYFVAPSYKDGDVNGQSEEIEQGNSINVKLNVEEFERRENQDDTQPGEDYPSITKVTEENYAYITLSEPQEEKEDRSYKQNTNIEQRATNNEESVRRTEDNSNTGDATEEPQVTTVQGDGDKTPRTGDQTVLEPHIYATSSQEPEDLEEMHSGKNFSQQREQFAPLAYFVAPDYEHGDVSGRDEETEPGNSINVKSKVELFEKGEIQEDTQTGEGFSCITRPTDKNYAYITLSEPQEQSEEEKEDGSYKLYTTVEQGTTNDDKSARRTEDNSNRGNATEESKIKNVETDDAKTPRTGDQKIEELHIYSTKSEESKDLERRDRGQTSNQQTEQYAPVAYFVAPSYEDGGVNGQNEEIEQGNSINVKLKVEEFERREKQDNTQAGEDYPRITKVTEDNYAYISLSELQEQSEEETEDGSYKLYTTVEQGGTNNEESIRRTEDISNRSNVTEEPTIKNVETDDAKTTSLGDQKIEELQIYPTKSGKPEDLEGRDRGRTSNQQTEQYAPVAYFVVPSYKDGDVNGQSEEIEQGNSINVKLNVEEFERRENQDNTQPGEDYPRITKVTEENYAYITLSEPQEPSEEEKEDGSYTPHTTIDQGATNDEKSARGTEDNSTTGNAAEEPQIKCIEADVAETPRTGDQTIEELHIHATTSEVPLDLEERGRGQNSYQQTEEYVPVSYFVAPSYEDGAVSVKPKMEEFKAGNTQNQNRGLRHVSRDQNDADDSEVTEDPQVNAKEEKIKKYRQETERKEDELMPNENEHFKSPPQNDEVTFQYVKYTPLRTQQEQESKEEPEESNEVRHSGKLRRDVKADDDPLPRSSDDVEAVLGNVIVTNSVIVAYDRLLEENGLNTPENIGADKGKDKKGGATINKTEEVKTGNPNNSSVTIKILVYEPVIAEGEDALAEKVAERRHTTEEKIPDKSVGHKAEVSDNSHVSSTNLDSTETILDEVLVTDSAIAAYHQLLEENGLGSTNSAAKEPENQKPEGKDDEAGTPQNLKNVIDNQTTSNETEGLNINKNDEDSNKIPSTKDDREASHDFILNEVLYNTVHAPIIVESSEITNEGTKTNEIEEAKTNEAEEVKLKQDQATKSNENEEANKTEGDTQSQITPSVATDVSLISISADEIETTLNRVTVANSIIAAYDPLVEENGLNSAQNEPQKTSYQDFEERGDPETSFRRMEQMEEEIPIQYLTLSSDAFSNESEKSYSGQLKLVGEGPEGEAQSNPTKQQFEPTQSEDFKVETYVSANNPQVFNGNSVIETQGGHRRILPDVFYVEAVADDKERKKTSDLEY